MQTPSSAPTNVELEGKGPEGKDRTSTKKSKGTSGGKVGDIAKAASGSGNDGSQRCIILAIIYSTCSYNDLKSSLHPGSMLLMVVEFLVYSAESGSEGSSDASDENANQQVYDYIFGIPVVIVGVLNYVIGKS